MVTTIHQPSSEMYDLFDNVLLMKEGKILCHAGTKETLGIFEKHGLPCDKHTNPAEHILTTAMDKEGEYESQLESIMKEYEENAIREVSIPFVYQEGQAKSANGEVKKVPKRKRFANEEDMFLYQRYKFTRPNWLTKFKILMWRSFISLLRDKNQTIVNLIMTIIMSVIIGLVFLRVTGTGQASVQNTLGAEFVVSILSTTFIYTKKTGFSFWSTWE